MVDKKYLFEKLTTYCKDIRGVDEHVLNAHLHQHGLTLRPDHRSFLLQYGNSSGLLKFWFGDCTYSLFEQYTSDTQEYLSGFEELPEGTVFLGRSLLTIYCVLMINLEKFIHTKQKNSFTVCTRVLMPCYFFAWLNAYESRNQFRYLSR